MTMPNSQPGFCLGNRACREKKPGFQGRNRVDWHTSSTLVAGLHLATLFGISVAQPLYDLLGHNAEFLVAHRCQRGDLLLLVGLLSLGLPAALVTAWLLCCPPSIRSAVHAILLGCLTAIVAVQVGNRLNASSAGQLVSAAAIAGAAFGVAYRRYRPVRMFLTALSPSIILFPALFLFGSSAARILRPDSDEIAGPKIDSNTPVVLIVFDEFSLTSLLDPFDRIDAGRFPHFAALAQEATWFRNATSVSYVTTSAVPAILTGKYPSENALPTLTDHPRNLFTFLGSSYDLKVLESVTSLCPPRLAGTQPAP